MSNKIFRKFVAEGITKNKKIVLPFLVAGTIIVMIFNILASLAYTPYIYHDGIEAFYGAQILSTLLEISFKVVGFFSVIFILYANNFVMKNRRKDCMAFSDFPKRILPLYLSAICWSKPL